MSKCIAKKIADWSVQGSIEDCEEYSVILYGIEVIVENSLKVVILISIGILLRQLNEVLIILFSFCFVRIHAGGIHATTGLGCTVLMIAVEIVGLIAYKFVQISGFTCLVLGLLSNILIWLHAPNGSKSCEFLKENAKKKKRRNALCSTNTLFLLSYCIDMRTLVFVPVFLEALSLLFFEIRGVQNERSKTVG